jgi:hypothetical protein
MYVRLFTAIAFLTSTAWGQATSAGGEIVGSVIDPASSPLATAQLTLSNEERGFSRTTPLREGGLFAFNIVPSGVYRLRVEASGFTTKVIDGIEVRVGDTV